MSGDAAGLTVISASPTRRSGASRSSLFPGFPVRGRASASDTKAFGAITSVTTKRKTLPPAVTRRSSTTSVPSRSTVISASASGNGDSKAISAVSPTW